MKIKMRTRTFLLLSFLLGTTGILALLASIFLFFNNTILWFLLFFVIAGVCLLGGIIFLLIGQERQAGRIINLLISVTSIQKKLTKDIKSLKSIKEIHSNAAITVIPEEIKVEVRLMKALIKELSEEQNPTFSHNIHLSNLSKADDVALEELMYGSSLSKEEKIVTPLEKEKLVQLVQTALKADKIEILLQPIVTFHKQEVKYYECFSRLRAQDGSLFAPEHFLKIAEDEGIVTAVDNTMLFHCVQLARITHKHHPDIGFFCNISPTSLSDMKFVDSFMEFISINNMLAPRLIFEIPFSLFRHSSAKIQKILKQLKEKGCPLSLDHMENLSFDSYNFFEQGVQFIKLDSEEIMNIENKKFLELKELRKKLKTNHIKLIITKIETQQAYERALELNADFGQGYYFSPPRLSQF